MALFITYTSYNKTLIQLVKQHKYALLGPQMSKESLSEDAKHRLDATVELMFSGGKGLLAMDEKPETIGKKFEQYEIENSAENRRRFRELLVGTKQIERYVGGVIFNEETVGQADKEGVLLTERVAAKGVAVGMKFDKGLVGPDADVAVGLEDLAPRMERAAAAQIVFAKWRAVFDTGAAAVGSRSWNTNIESFGQYVRIAQRYGVVPIVEPEILHDGPHSLQEMEDTAQKLYSAIVEQLRGCNAYLPGVVMKISFLASGAQSNEQETAGQIGRRTVELIERSLPSDIGAIVFLSGGHPKEEAFSYLKAVKKAQRTPGHLSFSFARALTNSVLETWAGDNANDDRAQDELMGNLASCCSKD
ncbi:fructose-bisphosphate aldolase, class I [Pancytospora philotis]|nr:fructose-bisphosphate aldolase, class I [Pancytospora philotis]